MAAQLGIGTRNNHGVVFTNTNFVIASGTPVDFIGLVGLNRCDIEATIRISEAGVVNPTVFRHRVQASGLAGEKCPGQQPRHEYQTYRYEYQIATPVYLGAERIKSHMRYRSQMEKILVTRDDNGVVTLTLNRPERKNAIDGDMWQGLIDIFDEVAANPSDRVLVITGSGDSFCSGADLNNNGAPEAGGGVGSALNSMRQVGRAALRLHELPKPTIAKVNGVAAGAGCNLALGCDLIIAADSARFSEIFARRGLSLDFGGSWLLPRLIGLHKAKELAYLADIISATEAEKFGIVNRVVPDADLDAEVTDLATRIAAQPPIQISATKKMLNQSLSVSMAEALEFESIAQSLAFSSRDTREAMVAFFEKREPKFTGE